MRRKLLHSELGVALLLALTLFATSNAGSKGRSEAPRLEDRLAIENVAQDYVRALDHSDLPAYLATLTADAKFLSKEGNYFGKAAIADYVRPVMEHRLAGLRDGTATNKGTHHVVTNVAIRFLTPDHAVMRSYWMFAAAKTSGGVDVTLMGSAEDHFVKRSGKWLISERHVETL